MATTAPSEAPVLSVMLPPVMSSVPLRYSAEALGALLPVISTPSTMFTVPSAYTAPPLPSAAELRRVVLSFRFSVPVLFTRPPSPVAE